MLRDRTVDFVLLGVVIILVPHTVVTIVVQSSLSVKIVTVPVVVVQT